MPRQKNPYSAKALKNTYGTHPGWTANREVPVKNSPINPTLNKDGSMAKYRYPNPVQQNIKAWNNLAEGKRGATVNVYGSTKSGQLSADRGRTHSGQVNGRTMKSSKNAQGKRTVIRQAVGNKITVQESMNNSRNSYMNKNTADKLLRQGKITQKEHDSMIMPMYGGGSQGGGSYGKAYRAIRKAQGLSAG